VNHGWLDTWHTFSFASYYDPAHMGFRALRVINDDKIAGGKGFPMHPHDNMEIVTYVLSGSLQHKDSLGNGGVIVPGEVQRMSAGTGIRHSEYNPSPKETVHLLQIWMEPNKRGIKPGYGQKSFPVADRQGKLKLVASPDGRDGSISIQSDTYLYATVLSEGQKAAHANAAGRHVWLHVARGELTLNGVTLKAGDAARTSDAGTLTLVAAKPGAEALLFDLA
jgi:redox-sensitive bicupin YhaK (pirin superfamily)